VPPPADAFRMPAQLTMRTANQGFDRLFCPTFAALLHVEDVEHRVGLQEDEERFAAALRNDRAVDSEQSSGTFPTFAVFRLRKSPNPGLTG